MSLVILFLFFSPLLHASEYTVTAHVFFVQPWQEHFSPEEQEAALLGIERAFAFWKKNGYEPAIHIQPHGVVIPSSDPYSTLVSQWFGSPAALPADSLTILVVDNETSGSFFFSHSAAYSQDYYQLIVSTHYPLAANSEAYEAALAHELGHVLYHLPDLYDGACSFDIMCFPLLPYGQGFVGCDSLAYLGRPCTRLFLPGVLFP